ncbi:cation:proton antiporter regulatory subunit [Lentzea sp. NEAU-D13]|uniref:Cation:proton antiporter regulatory subunit n=1 Tax=Lentzea alba TaxID=2714351 RepID=A0A7C9VUP2_9PSEU|nr:cation:proton antiporter regulatory subunit [Lentzea alba]NGY64333.1 cation:proton antiporter regulatory subunit [Lentzea alba]
MDVNEVLLPGVGLRYEFTNADRDHIAIVARREGTFEVSRYASDDPDEAQPLFRLTADEADTVAEILGAPRIAERFADLTKEVPGLSAGQIAVPAASSHAGKPLGHTRARTRTGASIVAIVRGDHVIASPTPDEVLRPGDVLVVIGTHDGINGVRQIIES